MVQKCTERHQKGKKLQETERKKCGAKQEAFHPLPHTNW
jgi:hypothetical protein